MCLLLLLLGNFLPFAAASSCQSYVVNLDEPAVERWKEVGIDFEGKFERGLKWFRALLPGHLERVYSELNLNLFLRHLPQPFRDELIGLSKYSKTSMKDLVFMQLFFDFSSMCTSVVCVDANNVIWHGRTLDYYGAEVLRELVIEVDFRKNNKTVIKGSTFAGLIGLFTGMKPGVFAVSLNQRPMSNITIKDNMRSALLQVRDMGAIWPVSFLIRSVLETHGIQFQDVIEFFKTTRMIMPSYIIVSGVDEGEGAVIARGLITTNLYRRLEIKKGVWYILQVNSDIIDDGTGAMVSNIHDDRFDQADSLLGDLTRKGISFANLTHLLASEPITNDLTAYTTIMSAKANLFHTTTIDNDNYEG